MATYDKLKSDLRDAFKQRGVRRVVYFHCDHFEPWRTIPGQDAICALNAAEVARFVDTSNSIDFARKLTLFYKCAINYVFDYEPSKSVGQRVDPLDQIRFPARPDKSKQIAASAMRYVAEKSAMDVQVHIHHENLTYNTDHKKPGAIEFFSSPISRRFEEQRFDLLVKLSLQAIEEETGVKLDRWFFVHGHWGLNASDPAVCHLTRELAILHANGCLGDFTVPSGRPVVNPRLEVPYFCTPIDAAKCYDLQECEPELAYGNATANARGKFLIWSSIIKHRGASLDYYAPWVRKRLEDLESLTREYVEQSYLVDGTLFMKTHAHSLHPKYYEDSRVAIFPHAYPPIQNLFCILFDAAASAGAEVSFQTVSEVYDTFVTANYSPPDGVALTMPGPPPIVEGCIPADRCLPLETVRIAPSSVAVPKASAPESAAKSAMVLEAVPRDFGQSPPAVDVTGDGDPQPLRYLNLVNDVARSVVLARIAALGEAASGAGNYYMHRVNSAAFLAEYEVELAKYLLSEPRFESYHEVGCGMGALPVLLAANGLFATGHEVDRKRIEGAQTVLEDVSRKLRGEVGQSPLACEFLHGRFPQTIGTRNVSKSLAFCTNVTATATASQRQDIIIALLSYSAVIVDLQRFIDRRTTRAEEDALLVELQAAGLSGVREIFSLGSGGRYVRFDR